MKKYFEISRWFEIKWYLSFIHSFQAVFCSKKCREEAVSSFHGLECSVLPHLHALDMGKNSILGLRLVTQMGLQKLKAFIREVSNGSRQSQTRIGYNPSGVYDTKDYHSIYHLVGNKESRTVGDIFKSINTHGLRAFTLF